MTAHPSSARLSPRSVVELLVKLESLQAEAVATRDAYDLHGGGRDERKLYHDGRSDAYAVACYWTGELRKYLRDH